MGEGKVGGLDETYLAMSLMIVEATDGFLKLQMGSWEFVILVSLQLKLISHNDLKKKLNIHTHSINTKYFLKIGFFWLILVCL